MKRIIALLLALVMVFALCACGKKESAPEEQVVVHTEKGDVVIPVSQGGETLDEPFFEILDARLKSAAGSLKGKFWLDLKVKCLYPVDKHENYPNPFHIYVTWLDKDGAIIKSDYYRLPDLNYEDIAWTSAYNKGNDSLMDLNEVATVKVTSYKAFLPEKNDWDEYHFDDPLVFTLADLETVE